MPRLPVSETMRTRSWLTSGAPTVSPRPVTMFTTPGGKTVGQHLGQLERGQRRLLGGLEDHRVAGRQGRASFQAAIISG